MDVDLCFVSTARSTGEDNDRFCTALESGEGSRSSSFRSRIDHESTVRLYGVRSRWRGRGRRVHLPPTLLRSFQDSYEDEAVGSVVESTRGISLPVSMNSGGVWRHRQCWQPSHLERCRGIKADQMTDSMWTSSRSRKLSARVGTRTRAVY